MLMSAPFINTLLPNTKAAALSLCLYKQVVLALYMWAQNTIHVFFSKSLSYTYIVLVSQRGINSQTIYTLVNFDMNTMMPWIFVLL